MSKDRDLFNLDFDNDTPSNVKDSIRLDVLMVDIDEVFGVTLCETLDQGLRAAIITAITSQRIMDRLGED